MPKLLIVDDEEDQEDLILQRFSGKTFLKEYEFIFTRNGIQALASIRKHPDIEIALVDINMPEMDGLTFLEKSKVIRPDLCCLMVSAYGDMSNIRTAMNRGAFDFLVKPIDFADLEITLRKTIAHVAQLREYTLSQHENFILKQHATELEMQALRAQMNPHFIFNSLNSINNFILKSEPQTASAYLVKFSKLIRMILENSIYQWISLEQELDALRLYIELESLRFQHQFNYEIRIEADLDTTSIKVHPLILQPFVENAIHHGLMPKNGSGTLSIQIAEQNKWLVLKIADDGIGRQQSGLKKSNGNPLHKSMGLAVTTERISGMTPDSAFKPHVEILDLTDASGKAAGTEVIIKIPLSL